MLLALVVITGQAKEKFIVWEQPTIEYGTSNGDGFFNLALDVTKVELKSDETVVYITASQRGDSEKYDYWFQFAGDTYLKVGEQRYTLVSADNIELNKHVYPYKDGKRDMVFHFPALPKDTKAFDFIEGDGQGAFQIKGIKPVEERWKQLFPSYWRDNQGDWKIAFFDDCAIYDIQYLYLANRSPQDSWENVIKEYNVSGPNVAHYNLPDEQQAAIERHLNVHSWPTYKLFNRDGDMLDLNVDPRDLENLARLLEQMK